MRIFFAAGGTAGHINPAIAMAQLIENEFSGAEFLFAVTPGGMESRLIPATGYPTVTLDVMGLQRRLTRKNFRALRLLVQSYGRTREIFESWHPDLVIGTGGYLTYPAVRTAQKMKIPNLLHESNAVPGLTVKLLAKRASVVLGGFPTVGEHLSRKCHFRYTGTPLRREFGEISRAASRRKLGISDGCFLVTSVGGSLGAERLNQAILNVIQNLYHGRSHICWILSTGKRFYSDVKKQAEEMGLMDERVKILPYIDDMAGVLAASDLVISRAGASTVTELSSLGVASILVPYPAATGDHQTKNAAALAALGGCILLPEENLGNNRLFSEISSLIEHPQKLKEMRQNAKALQPKKRDQLILGEIKQCISDLLP